MSSSPLTAPPALFRWLSYLLLFLALDLVLFLLACLGLAKRSRCLLASSSLPLGLGEELAKRGEDGAAVQRDEGLGDLGHVGSRGSLDTASLPFSAPSPGGVGVQPPSCRLDTKPGAGFPPPSPCLLGLTVPQLSR